MVRALDSDSKEQEAAQTSAQVSAVPSASSSASPSVLPPVSLSASAPFSARTVKPEAAREPGSLFPSPYSVASSQTVRSYTQVRPDYPQEVVERIWASLPGSLVAEMGAGTGIFTRQLLRAGARVIAVEPAAAMRAELEQVMRAELADSLITSDNLPTTLPRLQIVDAVAEDSGLPAGCVDGVVFAQSFHWMNQSRAVAEAARVLRPGGLVAVVANQLDVRWAWVHRLTRIMRSGDVLSPERGPVFAAPLVELPFFEVSWVQELSVAGVLELAQTRSSYVRQSPEGRARMQRNLRWYLLEKLGFCELDTVRIPYRTFLWSARKQVEGEGAAPCC